MIQPGTEKLISIREAARLLGVDRSTVRAWVGRGYLEAVFIGGRPWTSAEACARLGQPSAAVDLRTPAEFERAQREALRVIEEMGRKEPAGRSGRRRREA